MQPVRMTENLNPKLTKSDIKKNVRVRTEPVRIVELLRHSVNVNSIKKCNTSVKKKKAQPERLLPFCTNVKNTKSAGRHGKDTGIYYAQPAKSARRNLNFDSIPVKQSNAAAEPKIVTKREISNKSRENSARKSRCMPLVIKENIQRSKPRMSTRYSKIPEMSKAHKSEGDTINNYPVTRSRSNSLVPCASDTITKDSKLPVKQMKKTKKLQTTKNSKKEKSKNNIIDNEEYKIRSINMDTQSPKTFPSDVSIASMRMKSLLEASSITDLRLTEETDQSEINVPNSCQRSPTEKISTLQNDIIPDLNTCKYICTDGMICIRRDEFLSLKQNLEDLVQKTEENLFQLKSALSHIAKFSDAFCEPNVKKDTGSAKSETKSQTPIIQDIQDRKVSLPKSTSPTTNKTVQDTEMQIGQCCTTERLESSSVSTPKSLEITITASGAIEADPNQENKDPNNISINDSFLQIEDALQIKHTKELPVKEPAQQTTPALGVLRRKSTRSLREYIALKSNISFLATPDAKRFRLVCDNDLNKLSDQRHISNKLLADLQNLYADSPSSVS